MCPKKIEEMEIVKIKVDDDVPYEEARRRFELSRTKKINGAQSRLDSLRNPAVLELTEKLDEKNREIAKLRRLLEKLINEVAELKKSREPSPGINNPIVTNTTNVSTTNSTIASTIASTVASTPASTTDSFISPMIASMPSDMNLQLPQAPVNFENFKDYKGNKRQKSPEFEPYNQTDRSSPPMKKVVSTLEQLSNQLAHHEENEKSLLHSLLPPFARE